MDTEIIVLMPVLWMLTGFCFGLLAYMTFDLFFYREKTTELIDREYITGNLQFTECCNYGPILEENYCPMCSKKIIINEDNTASK